ncbi:MAG TPA: hypothetical protein V6D08_10200, partial [Candidatus Obscuribacterales bacterium]
SDMGKAFSIVGIYILSMLMWFRLSANWLSIFLTAEGFLLVLSGFYLSARSMRFLGLASFGALVVRLLLLELAHADSVHAVVSFCAAGGVLLAASWVYAFLGARYARVEPRPGRDPEAADEAEGDPAAGLPDGPMPRYEGLAGG